MRARYETRELDSGFRLAVATLPDSECLSISVHIPAGSRDDPPGKAGVAHFVEHMIFKGTERRSARDLSFETEDLGAEMNACTSEDQTIYEVRGEPDSLRTLSEILADMVWQSTFPQPEMELERGVIAEEIVMYEENPSEHIGDLLSSALWAPHPLGDPISGTLESLGRIEHGDLRDFAANRHRDPRLVIAVAGPHSIERVAAAFEGLLPSATEPLATPPFDEPLDGPRQHREPRETAQVQLALGFRCFGRRDSRRHALQLLSMVLGEGTSSRLFQSLREERGVCYHVASDVTLLDDTGALEIHAGVDPASRDEALDLIRAELHQLARGGPDNQELERAKRLYRSQLKSGLESTAAHAAWAGESLLFHQSIRQPADIAERIGRITAPEIQRVAEMILAPEREALAEIVPA